MIKIICVSIATAAIPKAYAVLVYDPPIELNSKEYVIPKKINLKSMQDIKVNDESNDSTVGATIKQILIPNESEEESLDSRVQERLDLYKRIEAEEHFKK